MKRKQTSSSKCKFSISRNLKSSNTRRQILYGVSKSMHFTSFLLHNAFHCRVFLYFFFYAPLYFFLASFFFFLLRTTTTTITTTTTNTITTSVVSRRQKIHLKYANKISATNRNKLEQEKNTKPLTFVYKGACLRARSFLRSDNDKMKFVEYVRRENFATWVFNEPTAGCIE